jgi:Prolipoprotein diacylglyceryltransferase
MNRFDPYSAMAFMGLIALLATQFYNFTQAGWPKRAVVKILFLSLLSVFAAIGFALAGFWQNEGILFSIPPSEWFEHIGFTAYHGIIGGCLSFLLGCRILKLEIRKTFSVAIPSVAIFMAFGRAGCSFAGCCYGIPVDFTILGLHFDKFPTAQLESLFFWLLFLSLQFFIKKRRVTVAVLSYAVFRFINEFFRGDDRGTLISCSPLSPAQIISLLAITVTLCVTLYQRNRQKRAGQTVPTADQQIKGGVRI